MAPPKSAKAQSLELNGQSFSRGEVYEWQPKASSGRYISRGIEEFENFVVPVDPAAPMLVRIDSDGSTKITLRSSQAEDAELPATQTLLIIALSAFSILILLDVLQLAFFYEIAGLSTLRPYSFPSVRCWSLCPNLTK